MMKERERGKGQAGGYWRQGSVGVHLWESCRGLCVMRRSPLNGTVGSMRVL